MSGRKLDVSAVKTDPPPGSADIKYWCGLPSDSPGYPICKAFLDEAAQAYKTALDKLNKLLAGKLDLCPDVIQKPTSEDFMPSNVYSTFYKIWECRNKIEANASTACLEMPMTDHGDGRATGTITLPIRTGCIKFTVPLDGGARHIDIRLPQGYKVFDAPGFVMSGTKSDKIVYRLNYPNTEMQETKTFTVQIRTIDNALAETDIVVDLFADILVN